MTNIQKGYLMSAGVLAPAFLVTLGIATAKGRCKVTGFDLIIFAGVSIVGGYLTAQMLKEK